MFGFKKPNYSVETIGTITGASAVQVNNNSLPLAEYIVNGQTYKVRVPYKLACEMELKAREAAGYEANIKDSIRAMKDAVANHNEGDAKVVRRNLNWGTALEGQLMFTIGKKVVVKYDPEKPNKAIVTAEYNE